MDVLFVVAWFGGVLTVVFGFFWAVEAVNENALRNYDYKPVNVVNALLMAPFWIFVMMACSSDRLDNILVASAFALAAILLLGWVIALNTSAPVGAASVLLLAVVGLVLLVAVMAIIVPRNEEER